jgi:hypothetical protein
MTPSLSLTAVVLLLAVTGCGGSGTPPEASPAEIAATPERFFGEEVTIEGRVSNPIDHRVWEVADGKLFVIYDRGLDRGLREGEPLRVTGEVRPLERRVIEDELGIDIEDHFFDEPFLDDDVAVVAKDVARL